MKKKKETTFPFTGSGEMHLFELPIDTECKIPLVVLSEELKNKLKQREIENG